MSKYERIWRSSVNLFVVFFSAVDVFITKSTNHYTMNFTATEYLKSLPSHACFASNPTENSDDKRDKCNAEERQSDQIHVTR